MIFNNMQTSSVREDTDIAIQELTSLSKEYEKVAQLSAEYSKEYKLDNFKDLDEKKTAEKAKKSITDGNKMLSNILAFGGGGGYFGGMLLAGVAPIVGIILIIVGGIATSIGMIKEGKDMQDIYNDAKTTIRLMRKIRDKLKPGTKEYEKVDDAIKKLSDKIESKFTTSK